MNLERLYLDYNATSPLSESVINWLRSGDFLFANPSSQHTDGKASRKMINQTRSRLYELFGQNEKDVRLFFHSGATEAIHTIAHSFSEMARLQGKDLLICYSRVDHPAVTSLSEKFLGPQVKTMELLRDEKLHYLHEKNFEILKDKKDNNPDLIILYHHLWVHNETGEVADPQELERFKTIPDLYIHVDAVQTPGKITHWEKLGVGDVWSYSGHKFGALKGIGWSFVKQKLPFYPLICGGGQQSALRSGTENVPGIESIRLALSDLQKVDIQKTQQLRKKLLHFMAQELAGLGEVHQGEQMASNTIYFYLHHIPSDIALALFDLNGVEISAGSACSSGAAKSSLVLTQMGLQRVAKNGLRLSLPLAVDEEYLNKVQQRLLLIFNKLRHS